MVVGHFPWLTIINHDNMENLDDETLSTSINKY